METVRYDQLEPEDRELVDAAKAVLETAYAPYSGVHVGAALRTATGIVAGSNVENAAYGSTLCAERVAMGRANARGERAFTTVAVTVHGGKLGKEHVVSPCGECRQVLHEMASVSGSEPRILMGVPGTEQVVVATLAELLPLPFDALGR